MQWSKSPVVCGGTRDFIANLEEELNHVSAAWRGMQAQANWAVHMSGVSPSTPVDLPSTNLYLLNQHASNVIANIELAKILFLQGGWRNRVDSEAT